MNSQTRILLSDISGQGARHLSEIQADLAQIHLLLEEAVAKLAQSFAGIAQAASACQDVVARLEPTVDAEQTSLDSEGLSHLGAANEALALHVNAAVTGLQFEDIAAQLIGRVGRRVEGLREMLDSLDDGTLEALDEGGENSKEAVLLARMAEVVRARSQRIDSQLRQAVGQRHMGCGDMELF